MRPVPSRYRIHPAYRTAGLEFVPYGASERLIAACRLPAPGELVLWRMRVDWQAVSPGKPQAWVAPEERRKAAHFPSAGLARQYLVGHAALRRLLAAMLQCSGEQIHFVDRLDGGIDMVAPALPDPPGVHIARAGIWIIVGVSAGRVGIGSAMPATNQPLDDDTADHFRSRAWQASLAALTGAPFAAEDWSVIACGATNLVTCADATRYQTLDLPMQGKLFAAVALASPVWQVRAYGWRRC